MQKSEHKRIIFLTSSFVRFQAAADYCPTPISNENGFRDELRALWKADMHFLIFAADPDDASGNDYVKREMLDGFTLAGLPVSGIRVFDRRCEESLDSLLEWADVLYLAGGHAPTQNHFMQEVLLKQKLEAFDGIIIGLSAGSMNSAQEVYMMPELEGEALDPKFRRRVNGLGLTKLNIVPHSEYIRACRLDGLRMYEDILIPDSEERCIFFIPDGAYFKIEDGITTFYGEGERIENRHIFPVSTGTLLE